MDQKSNLINRWKFWWAMAALSMCGLILLAWVLCTPPGRPELMRWETLLLFVSLPFGSIGAILLADYHADNGMIP